VLLPLRPATAPPGAPDASPEGRAPHALRLLLVEDEDAVADVIAGLLEGQGHRVRRVAHGLAALSEIAGQPFDAALLDLDLPGIDGLALAPLLRQNGFTGPLVAVTARTDADAEAAAAKAGFDAFLRKPVTGAMLEQALAGVLPARASTR
jgi:CheY-like chemotaxis protein